MCLRDPALALIIGQFVAVTGPSTQSRPPPHVLQVPCPLILREGLKHPPESFRLLMVRIKAIPSRVHSNILEMVQINLQNKTQLQSNNTYVTHSAHNPVKLVCSNPLSLEPGQEPVETGPHIGESWLQLSQISLLEEVDVLYSVLCTKRVRLHVYSRIG